MVKICVVGLGYVGLPLISSFAQEGYQVTGYDINVEKVSNLQNGIDETGQLSESELLYDNLSFTTDESCLDEVDFVFLCVPTALDQNNNPDLSNLKAASRTVGSYLQTETTVVYESTVYPGTTEDVCLPILEDHSGLELGDFSLAYSPERVNPGDDLHTFQNVSKIVAGHDAATADELVALYDSVINESIHRAPSIKVAEAAKVIENTQRDLNIALMNELSMIFDRMNIDTQSVIDAAATKWNFHSYHPGLVGGHCIGIDPYYLTYKAKQEGYDPRVILAGRSINDQMYELAVDMLLKGLNDKEKVPKNSTVLVFGMTFKENVKDARNSKVKPLVRQLEEYGTEVYIHDPVLGSERITDLGFEAIPDLSQIGNVDGIVYAVPHDAFDDLSLDDIRSLMDSPLLVDIRSVFDKETAQRNGFYYRSF